ncbi:hypothetical protein GCM10008907_30320 [Clostridium sartagoforme]
MASWKRKVSEELWKGEIMKIEMGESLILSWLKHIKNCQLIQLNWTVSPEWSFHKNLSSKSCFGFAKVSLVDFE